MISSVIDIYEDGRNVSLTSYLQDYLQGNLNGRKRPAVLICPGGGYLGCSDHEAEPVALRFAAMGYHAFVLRYSTYYGKTPDNYNAEEMIKNKETMHPAPLRDIGKSFLVLRDNAQTWSIDMDQIIICGFSAGAHNCLMYSVYWDKPIITDFFKEDASHFKPAAAIFCYGLADFRMLYSHNRDSNTEELRKALMTAFLGTIRPDEKLLSEVTPLLHLSKSIPPAFIWTTSEDELVTPENSLEIAKAYAKAGIPYEIHIFESGLHGLSLADGTTAANEQQIDTDAAGWLGLAFKWLAKRMDLYYG